MKKLAIVLATALIAVGAAGCSAQGGDAQPQSAAQNDAVTAPTAAPITMAPEAPEPASSEPAKGSITEDQYLLALSQSWHGQLPADSDLIGAGKLACEQLAAGTPEDAVRVIQGEGDDADWNNRKVIGAAIQAYCVEFFD